MCARGNACGCSGGSSGLKVIAVAVVIAAAAADGAAAAVVNVIMVAAVTMAVLVAVSIATLVYVLRRENAALYAPVSRRALPATRSPALPARSPAAISTGRQPIPVTAITIHEEGIRR